MNDLNPLQTYAIVKCYKTVKDLKKHWSNFLPFAGDLPTDCEKGIAHPSTGKCGSQGYLETGMATHAQHSGG